MRTGPGPLFYNRGSNCLRQLEPQAGRMNYRFGTAILVVGLSGIAAQVLILRELLIGFLGNELTIGIILANWVIIEAAGVYMLGKIVDRIKDKLSLFIVLEIIFSLFLPLCVYLARSFKDILGVSYGEGLGLGAVFFVSLLILLPVSFSHGGLFSAGCRIYSVLTKEPQGAIGKVYSWETIGTLLGGIILTYFFIPFLNTLQTAFVIAVINLLVSLLFLRDSGKIMKYVLFTCLALMFFLFSSGTLNKLNRTSIDRQYRTGKVLDYQNSIYGNVAVTKRQEQLTFFYNGIPIITAPYPDRQFVEDFGHLPLLFSKAPKDILVIGSGAGGLINEIFKHPVRRLDYVELDPLLIEMIKKYPTALTDSEIKDKRINIVNQDGRFYLRSAMQTYDCIMLGLSNQSNLSTNRLFTAEFFAMVKNKLNKGGLLALWLPGSLTYWSPELKNINSCVLKALTGTFDYVRIIPGEFNIYLASPARDILEVTPGLIYKRLSEFEIKSSLITVPYLEDRLSDYWLDWFNTSMRGGLAIKNEDLRPVAVFQNLLLWNRQFSAGVACVLKAFENLSLRAVAIFLSLVTFLIYLSVRGKQGKKPLIAYSIFTTGFFAMLISLILIFSYQVFYGYLYRQIGLLVSVFMFGTAAGSMIITSYAKKIKNALSFFLGMELSLIIFCPISALALTGSLWQSPYSQLVFIGLFFISGLLAGLEFPLAAKIYPGKNQPVGYTSGVLYGSDLLGGWAAGITGSVILIPVLGIFNACMVMLMLKLSSFLLLAATTHE